jgi:hypothetical protein
VFEGVATKKSVILAEIENNSNINPEEDQKQKNSSQSQEINVKKDKKLMKIEKLSDINEETLKTLSASAISDFIEEELKRASDDYSVQLTEKDEALQELQTKSETLEADQSKMSDEFESVKSELGTLKEEQAERDAQEQFNNRMSAMDEAYELNDEDRKVIASDIKDLDEQSFSDYREKMAVLLRAKSKEVIAEEKAKEEAEAKKAEKQTEEAAETEANEKETAEDVLDNVQEDSEDIPSSSEATDASLYEKYRAAFGLDQFEISNKR